MISIDDVPKPTNNPFEKMVSNEVYEIVPFGRVHLGREEPAICAAFGLSPDTNGDNPEVNLVLLDVGFKKTDNGFGPYDLDGSGEKRTFKSNYVLMTRDPDTKETRFAEIEPKKGISLGRKDEVAKQLGYDQNNLISSKQAFLGINEHGVIRIRDEDSTNGTTYIPNLETYLGIEGDPEFDYTSGIGDRVSEQIGGRYRTKEEVAGWGHGMVDNRPVIASDTPINGGAYPVGGKDGEILIFDDVKYSKSFDQIYDTFLEVLQQGDEGEISVSGLRGVIAAIGESIGKDDGSEVIFDTTQSTLGKLRAIFNKTKELLPYDLPRTETAFKPGQKVSLAYVVNELGFGVCRHQMGLSAYVIERLIRDGRLNGKVRLNRNLEDTVNGERGGHAWTRYEDETGQVYIIDAAQDYVGTLEDAQKRGFGWDYRRTEDHIKTLLAA